MLVFAVVALVASAGATAAWAQSSGDRATRRAAVRECVAQVRAADPGRPKSELKDDVRACLEAKGITLPKHPRLTDEQKARLKECRHQARTEHPGDKPAIRAAVRDCLGLPRPAE